MTPWRLVTLVDADASDMGLNSVNRTLARLHAAVNDPMSAEDSRAIFCRDTVRRCDVQGPPHLLPPDG